MSSHSSRTGRWAVISLSLRRARSKRDAPVSVSAVASTVCMLAELSRITAIDRGLMRPNVRTGLPIASTRHAVIASHSSIDHHRFNRSKSERTGAGPASCRQNSREGTLWRRRLILRM